MITSGCQVDLFRLPRRVQPVKYGLELYLDPDKVKFSGSVTIEMQFRKHRDTLELLRRTVSSKLPPFARDRKSIILNAERLNIVDVKFEQGKISFRPPVHLSRLSQQDPGGHTEQSAEDGGARLSVFKV